MQNSKVTWMTPKWTAALEEHTPKLASEFIGTFFLVFTIGCNVLNGNAGAALSIGAMLTVMICALGPVSGAHLNPAVTLAALVCGKGTTKLNALLFVFSQVLGGMFGAVTYLQIQKDAFKLAPVAPHSEKTAWACEFFFTCALCFVVLRVCQTQNAYFGLAIGSTVTVGAITIGPISGGSLNPAVSIGSMFASSLVHGRTAWEFWSLYVNAPFFGGLAGAGLFILTTPTAGKITEKGTGPKVIAADRNRKQTVFLQKNEIFELDAEVPIVCGCGWRMKEKDNGTDIDVSAVKFSKTSEIGCVYFANKGSPEEGIWCEEDDIHGSAPREEPAGGVSELSMSAASEHNEQIHLRLDRIKWNVHAIVFVVTVFSSGKDFKDVHDFFVSVAPEVGEQQQDLCRYSKADGDQGNAVIVAMVFRSVGKWYFKAIDVMHELPPNTSAASLTQQCGEQVFETLEEAEELEQ